MSRGIVHRLRSAVMVLAGGMLTLAVAPPAIAHKASDAYLSLQVDGRLIEQRLDIALRDLDRELGLDADDDGLLHWGEVRGRWAEIERLADAGLTLLADGQPCPVQHRGPPQLDSHSDGRHAVLTARRLCAAPVQRLALDYRLFQHTDASHRGLLRLQSGGAAVSAVLVPGTLPQTLLLQGDASGPASLVGFVREGIFHLLLGIDHILFLLTLLLPAGLVRTPAGWVAADRLRPVMLDVLKLVTAFTVAHSITLALAVFDFVDPPSRWVESLIAASVVAAALDNLLPLLPRRRWLVTGAFGLVHGFGFAGALKDLRLGGGALAGPLFAFNLGVELGQLLIVALIVPLAWWLRPQPAYRRLGLAMGSGAIALLASVWLAERAGNLALPDPSLALGRPVAMAPARAFGD